jgi:hypothetical protein
MAAPIWQVGGMWEIKQDNGFRVKLDLRQDGGSIDGSASHSNETVRSREARGSVTNEEFQLNIKWNNGTEGRYIGKFDRGFFTSGNESRLHGATVDLANPSSSSGWEALERTFTQA